MAYTLPENLYPNSYSFSSSDLSIFNAENGKIKTRPLKRGVVYISMSWTLSELDYIDFIDMYNIYLDYGIEPFEADIASLKKQMPDLLKLKNNKTNLLVSLLQTVTQNLKGTK